MPKRSAAHPQSRLPLTSERAQAKPSIGRLGCMDDGSSTRASMPSQSRTLVISPKGTPVCAMPHGPGFMPTSSTSCCPAPYRSQVGLVRAARVDEGVVDRVYGRGEREGVHPLRERATDPLERHARMVADPDRCVRSTLPSP